MLEAEKETLSRLRLATCFYYRPGKNRGPFLSRRHEIYCEIDSTGTRSRGRWRIQCFRAKRATDLASERNFICLELGLPLVRRILTHILRRPNTTCNVD